MKHHSGNSEFHRNESQSIELLTCHGDYEAWYLRHHDFSCFSSKEIKAVLLEDKPQSFPCVPLISDDRYSIAYLGVDLLEVIFSVLKSRAK